MGVRKLFSPKAISVQILGRTTNFRTARWAARCEKLAPGYLDFGTSWLFIFYKQWAKKLFLVVPTQNGENMLGTTQHLPLCAATYEAETIKRWDGSSGERCATKCNATTSQQMPDIFYAEVDRDLFAPVGLSHSKSTFIDTQLRLSD